MLSLQVWRVKIDRLRVMKAFLLSRVPRWHKASYSVKESSLIWVSSFKSLMESWSWKYALISSELLDKSPTLSHFLESHKGN